MRGRSGAGAWDSGTRVASATVVGAADAHKIFATAGVSPCPGGAARCVICFRGGPGGRRRDAAALGVGGLGGPRDEETVR
ncbi:hypothetical protein THAOC_26920, partial [Thalassiosira oceanica]